MAVSEGIAIGTLVCHDKSEESVPEFPIAQAEVDREISRYRRALSSSRKDLHDLQDFLAKEGAKEAVTIIDTHIQMLDDPVMTTLVEEKIRDSLKNTESVFKAVITDYERQFSRVKDAFFRERLSDVQDLSSRIMHNLGGQAKEVPSDPSDAIIFAKEFIPSETASVSQTSVSAFLSQIGGNTSHAALIARAKGIPFVVDIDVEELKEGVTVIVDGLEGEVILSPKPSTLKAYQKLLLKLQKTGEELKKKGERSETQDGLPIEVFANVESPSDLEHLPSCQGVGLVRTEFLFGNTPLPQITEANQIQAYRAILDAGKGIPTTFRVFDVGGDKPVQGNLPEDNPALGYRGIRYLLHEKGLFKTQIRALLKAHDGETCRILFPLITDVEELREAKGYMAATLDELGVAVDVKYGAMIEVPAAALMADLLAKECDFLSIGTNDLIQFTLASDRSNQVVSPLYKSSHPSVLRLLRTIALHAESQATPVGICGEMASNPLYTALLVGLGLRHLSCAPRYIPVIQATLAQFTLEEAKRLAKNALQFSSSDEIHRDLIAQYQSN